MRQLASLFGLAHFADSLCMFVKDDSVHANQNPVRASSALANDSLHTL